ncbi:MAG: hypothetical protein ACRDCE_15125 [Cetobacterium sp.]|uniref:hypothetical protein n=1 Tax=Cetobacterium sp. TaxID=2071632 RepID=UPI003EE7C1F0
MGKLMGGKDQSQSQTTETSPWGPAQGALEAILGNAGELFDKNGGINGNWIDKNIADLTPEMQQAVKDLMNSQGMKDTLAQVGAGMQAGIGGIGQSTGVLGGLTQQGITGQDINKLASELYDNEMVASQKQQLTQDVQKGLDKNIQGLNQQASAGGNMGSSRAGVAEGVAIGEAGKAIATGSANIENAARQSAYGQALGTLQGNQSTALGAAGQLGQIGLGSGQLGLGMLNGQNQILQNQLMGAGIGQNHAQNILNNQWFNQQGQANAGWDNLSKYLGIAGAIGGMGGTSTTTGKGNSGGGGLSSIIGAGSTAMGGLGALGWKPFSDVALKKNIKATGGKTKKGFKEYTWDWNDAAKEVGKKGKEKGVLAQQVAKKDPSAVQRDEKTGYLMVDYDKV